MLVHELEKHDLWSAKLDPGRYRRIALNLLISNRYADIRALSDSLKELPFKAGSPLSGRCIECREAIQEQLTRHLTGRDANRLIDLDIAITTRPPEIPTIGE